MTFPHCSIYRAEFRGCPDLYVVADDLSQATAAACGYKKGFAPDAVLLKVAVVADNPQAIIDATRNAFGETINERAQREHRPV
jgi:hypothetical protein